MSQFNNSSSHCLFIGKRNLDEVILEDTQELQEINGSFDAIAERMNQIVSWAESVRKGDYDNKVTVLSYNTYRGMQECPFDSKCLVGQYRGWNEDVKIKSKKTGKQLVINSGTAHLAKVHHLLEKDNEYGISAREFYESFM
ncbi:Uncharacterised protein [uncultured archaeon]|nr:Uncharacterised protein [uncultured archaeon]